jgi:hypothetical protein
MELNCDDESQFSPFMMNRWISFYSPEMCSFINDTCNKYIPIHQTKQEHYNYYFNILPKLRFKKIAYIKKPKKETDTGEKAPDIHVPEFMSKREYNNYVEFEKDMSK